MQSNNVARDLEGHIYNRMAFILVLLFGSFTMSISQSAVSTAYPTLMKSWGISMNTVQWLTTGLMLIMCVMMPASPWFLNNMKFKNLFLLIAGTFDVGTLIIVLAPNFPIMMFGRVLEALAMGILFPSFQSVLLYITPKNQRGGVMGLAGLIMGSALACGPIVSGIILNFFQWRGVFLFFLVVITAIFVLALFFIKDVMPQKKSHLDVLSVIYSIGLIGILYFINLLKQGFSSLTAIDYVILFVGLLMVALFIHRQFNLKEPLLNLRVMKVFNYDLAVGLTCFSYIALIVVTIIFPTYYQKVLGVSKLVSGLALVPGAAFLSFLNPYTGKLTSKIGFKKTMLIGMFMILVGWGILSLTNNLGLVAMMILAAVIEGGNAFVMMPSVTMGANSLPKELVSHGTALITTMRQIMGSTGVVVATLILTGVAGDMNIASKAAIENGYHVAFITFFVIEIVGMIIALMIRNPKKANN